MRILSIITIFLNIILMTIICYFVSKLKWRESKASVIGFWWMIIVYLLDIVLIGVRL